MNISIINGINISSQSGILAVPVNSIYTASKYAVEGLSESLMYELNTLNIKTKLILLGAVESNFLKSQLLFPGERINGYDYINKVVIPEMKRVLSSGENANEIAKEIFKAASDVKNKLHHLAGKRIKITYRM